MAALAVETGELVVRLSPVEKIGALRGDVRVPLAAVRTISVVPEPWGQLRGIRAPGTGFPRLIMLGTCRGSFGKDFTAVYGDQLAISVRLQGAEFQRLLVCVSNPVHVAATLREVTGLTPQRRNH